MLNESSKRLHKSCWTHTQDGQKYPSPEHFAASFLPAGPPLPRPMRVVLCPPRRCGLRVRELRPGSRSPWPVISLGLQQMSAAHLHGLTISLLPTHPVGKSSQDPLPSLVPCPSPSHHRACSSHAGPWGWQDELLMGAAWALGLTPRKSPRASQGRAEVARGMQKWPCNLMG